MNTNTLSQNIKACLNAGCTPLIRGVPGIGKTQIAQKTVEELYPKKSCKILNLATMTREDFGYPNMERLGEFTNMLVPEMLSGHSVLILDEVDKVDEECMGPLLELVQKKTINSTPCCEKVILTANPPTEGYSNIPTPLVNRCVLFNHVPNYELWKNWAKSQPKFKMILKYLKDNCDNFYNRDNDGKITSPRSWEMLSNFCQKYENDNNIISVAAQSLLSKKVANSFLNYHNITPTFKDLKNVINAFYTTRTPLIIRGTRGGGKTAIIEDFSKKMGLTSRLVNASVLTREDLLGYPRITNEKVSYLKLEMLHKFSDVLFFDEIDKASHEVLAAFLELFQSNSINSKKVCEWVVGASNTTKEGFGDLPSPLINRCGILDVPEEEFSKVFLEWISDGKLNKIGEFIQRYPEQIFQIDGELATCPRTLEIASKLPLDLISNVLHPNTAQKYLDWVQSNNDWENNFNGISKCVDVLFSTLEIKNNSDNQKQIHSIVDEKLFEKCGAFLKKMTMCQNSANTEFIISQLATQSESLKINVKDIYQWCSCYWDWFFKNTTSK